MASPVDTSSSFSSVRKYMKFNQISMDIDSILDMEGEQEFVAKLIRRQGWR